jgi:NAD+ diphosphatase
VTRPRFERLHPPALPPAGPASWLLFSGDELLMPAEGPPRLLDGDSAGPGVAAVAGPRLLGVFDGRPVLFASVEGELVPAGLRRLGLRALLGLADSELVAVAGYAAQLVHWERTSRFCPACGQLMQQFDGWGKTCGGCGHARYPQLSPVAIVLIYDDEGRLLLTTKPGWGARYSLVAGFVEPGETVEQCVSREVREEVGVEVDTISYVGSQPWPFPHQLMLGFTARYAGGEIVVDTSELADARWFAPDALPELPPPFSIARQILDAWRAGATPARH